MRDRNWIYSFLICAAAAAMPFLATYRMPMADLPQHQAQIALWEALDDPCYGFSEVYELNLVTPYVLGNVAIRLLAEMTSINMAFKIAVWLSVVMLALVLRKITSATGIDPTLTLLSIPIGFGFSFYWGFVSFMMATPLAIFLVLEVLFPVESRRRHLLFLGILSGVLLALHALAFAAAACVAGMAAICIRWKQWKMLGQELLSLGWSGLLLVLWVLQSRGSSNRAQEPLSWELSPARFWQFFEHLISPSGDPQSMVVILLILSLIAISGVRITSDRCRMAVALLALSIPLIGPYGAMGQIFLNARFATFSFLVAFVALEVGKPRIRQAVLRWMVVTVVCVWMVVLAARFSSFHRDARSFDDLIAEVPSNQTLLLLNVVPRSEAVPGMPFLHHGMYYEVLKGGFTGWSFAANFPPVIRFREDAYHPSVPPVVTHQPRLFDWRAHGQFDYVMVRSPVDVSSIVFRGGESHFELLGSDGWWWLYENHLWDSGRPECPPLREAMVDPHPFLTSRPI